MPTPPRIPYHPAYGYATPEQVEELKRLGRGPDYDQLWKKIEYQTKKKGIIE